MPMGMYVCLNIYTYVSIYVLCSHVVYVFPMSISVHVVCPMHISGLHMCACVPEKPAQSMPERMKSPWALKEKGSRVCSHRTLKFLGVPQISSRPWITSLSPVVISKITSFSDDFLDYIWVLATQGHVCREASYRNAQ